MEWFALAIPIVVALVLYFAFHKDTTWWELLIPAAVSAIFILIFKTTVGTSLVTDTEYFGNKVVAARYYEYWETWVVKTCSEQYACGTERVRSGKSYTTRTKYCTRYYDCSYCDRNQPYWVAIDENGKEYRISEEYYNKLMRKWSANPVKIELNRRINYHLGCGKDGDAFEIKWDGQSTTSEVNVTEHTYTNKVQASHSNFKLKKIEPEEAKKLGLYDYPGYYDYYKQRTVLGLERIYGTDSVDRIETMFQYINGHYGPRNHVKLFVCLFYNQPMDIAFKQEAYWSGGNQNEVVICLGLDPKTRQIQWVKPFSWTDNKQFMVDVREDIAHTKVFNPMLTQQIIANQIKGDLHKSFEKDFDYLSVDLPTWTHITIWIVTLLITLGIAFWVIINDHKDETVEASGTDYRYVKGKDGVTRYLPARSWMHESTWNKFKRKWNTAIVELKEKDRQKELKKQKK